MLRTTPAILCFALCAGAALAQDATEPPAPEPVGDEAVEAPVEEATEAPPPVAVPPAAPEPAPPPTPAAEPPEEPEPAVAETPPGAEGVAPPAAAEKPFVERAVIRGAHGVLAGGAAATTMLASAGAGYVFYQLAISDPTFLGQLAGSFDDALFAALTLGTWFFAPLASVAVAAASVWLLGGESPAWRVVLDGLVGVGVGGLLSGIPGAALGAVIGLSISLLGSTSDPAILLGLTGLGAGAGFLVLAPLGAAAGAVGGSAIGGFLGADPNEFEWE